MIRFTNNKTVRLLLNKFTFSVAGAMKLIVNLTFCNPGPYEESTKRVGFPRSKGQKFKTYVCLYADGVTDPMVPRRECHVLKK